ncbi:hypothetical protein II5_05910 [Bacillus cereus MSX-A1]|uniref:YxeA family protein n=1 Tax=Bacillus cereus TaxID=1396 RepID=UPI00027978E2|nr:YxeA family protein [Bacillus cereus]EJQ97831.1 hypothetical protein II5_05910 [Bacillus cereus MSX-A1]MDR4293830.1 YxeA family protein [Bacillus cereus]
MKRWLVLLVLIIITTYWFTYKGGIFIDGVNPFLKENDYYVLVSQEGESIKSSGYKTWRYQFTGYSASGVAQELPLIVSKQLKVGAYLQIHSKGTNVKKWEEVQWDELPNQIKRKLRN